MFKKTTYRTLRSGRKIVAGTENRSELIGWLWITAFVCSLGYIALALTK